MGKFKIQKSATVNQYADAGNVIGGTGGLTSIAGTQIRPNVYITGASTGAYGSIKQQKGRGKFLVTDGTYTGQCTLQNLPNANLSSGQMSIGIDTAYISYCNVNVASSPTTFAWIRFNSANLNAVTTPAVNDFVRGVTGIVGNVKINSYSVVSGVGNANVSFDSSQSFSNVAATSVYTGQYAQRLTNKFVRDFAGNKYQWTFGNPTATTVRIPGA
jgi:hypothetical protein